MCTKGIILVWELSFSATYSINATIHSHSIYNNSILWHRVFSARTGSASVISYHENLIEILAHDVCLRSYVGETHHKQILASDLFRQTNSFRLIKWKCWKRRPSLRRWYASLCHHHRHRRRRHHHQRRHGCCHHHYQRCFNSLTVRYYCLYVNFTVAPTHKHPHIVNSFAFCCCCCCSYHSVAQGYALWNTTEWHRNQMCVCARLCVFKCDLMVAHSRA